MNTVRSLEPRALWNQFEDLNAIPRASKKEEQVLQHLKDFARQHGLVAEQDATGNVVIRKPATAGMEQRQTVIMQAHVDMVHQKNSDVTFDFDRQGIESYIDGDWVRAKGTTLGADNGLGAAAILAVLASSDMAHPAIEALFTVDEEAGMTGAKNLQPGWLKGTLLLNLDTEEDDEFTIGCAGGIDTFSRFSYPEQPVGSHEVAVQLQLRGLVGGHSGMDIHRGFGNANKLLVRAMLETGVPFRLASMDGGSLRNAIPREAQALVVLAGEHKADFVQRFQASAEVIRREYATTDPKMQCEVTDAALPARAAAVDISMSMARAISACPNGADRWSPDMDNLVETSSNLARVIVGNGHFETQSLQRSAINAARDNMAHRVADVFRLLGAEVEHKGAYPGWAPNPHSALVDHMVRIYTAMHGEAPRVMACHAGLECGIIGEQYPHLDMISFGPTIRGAHSPDERASIASAQKFWHFLTRVLAEIPAA